MGSFNSVIKWNNIFFPNFVRLASRENLANERTLMRGVTFKVSYKVWKVKNATLELAKQN